ncbi:DUF1553 domain-containing protein [bacterium]|nr:DUF1553 domain-containing protein [bacterium]
MRGRFLTRILPLLIVVTMTAPVAADDPSSSQHASESNPVQFNRDIRPILSENCLFCHGFDEANRAADLRLDTYEGATESAVIFPGDPESSEVMRRILSNDPHEVMPPPESEKDLSQDEIELLRLWIEQGAKYEEHWAWSSLNRPAVPGEKTDAAAIDAFLEQSWREQGLKPVHIASPRQRLRRLSYDLRGLPPSYQDVVRFEADPSEEAFLAFREQWMNELAYAEHQAVRWLDLVRWADTSGFVSDEPIASGAYRAWVIEAIRENKPFDEFSTAQLAGDLLPDPTDKDLIASGYNRIVNTNCEAGAIEEEQLYKLKGEHVRAFGTVWLGMTTGCAECHDHKFDPVTARDYYSLAAFFDDLVEAGVYTPGDRREPLHYVHQSPETSKADRTLNARRQALEAKLETRSNQGQDAWEQKARQQLSATDSRADFAWIPGMIPAARIVEGEYENSTLDGRDVRITAALPDQFLRHHVAETITGYIEDRKFKTDGKLDAWFVDVWIDPEHRPSLLGFQISSGKYGRLGWLPTNYETYFWGEDSTGTLQKSHAWSQPDRVKHMGPLPEESGWVRLRVPFEDAIPRAGGQAFERVGMSWIQTGGRVAWGTSGLELRADKKFTLELAETAMRKWWETPMNRQVYQSRVDLPAKALKKSTEKRDDTEQEIVFDLFREHNQPELMAQLRSLESKLFEMRAQAEPVLVSRQADEPKVTRVLHRGDYQDKTGPIVDPAVPAFLGELEVDQPTRLDLARWLFTDNSALTARVYVNRMWEQFYGRGLSESLEDAGTQGAWPSHLALLDWLACEFRDSGWDRRHLVRLLTSTRAYQLSSVPSSELADQDPTNRWHARQSRHRLSAEEVRDSALHAAGLLKLTAETPRDSFFPYQPHAYWSRSDKVMYGSRHMLWDPSEKRDQYTRTLYTFWKRQSLHPTLLAFDAPTRQECTAQRNVTNTPGQALALLNDPIFVEAARGLATRLIEQQAHSDEERMQAAFQLVLQREASPEEQSVLLELLEKQRRWYEQNSAAADELIGIGQFPAPAGISRVETAAWMAVSRALLNLHEFLNRA